MSDPRGHTAPIFRAWDVGVAVGRDGPDGTENPPCDDTRDHRDHCRGYQSGQPAPADPRRRRARVGPPEFADVS